MTRGGSETILSGDPVEGTMRRSCRKCDAEHFVAGSGDYWSEEDIQIMVCVCEEEDFDIEIEWSVKNLDSMSATVIVALGRMIGELSGVGPLADILRRKSRERY